MNLDISGWKNFTINEIFYINSSKKKFNADKIQQIYETQQTNTYPYVVRSAVNNGIRGYINENTQFLNEANTISFGQDTATMFYQDKPYFTGDKIKIFSPKNFSLNHNRAIFLILILQKAFAMFEWGKNSFKIEILENLQLKLPTLENGEINLNFMENYIKATQNKISQILNAYEALNAQNERERERESKIAA